MFPRLDFNKRSRFWKNEKNECVSWYVKFLQRFIRCASATPKTRKAIMRVLDINKIQWKYIYLCRYTFLILRHFSSSAKSFVSYSILYKIHILNCDMHLGNNETSYTFYSVYLLSNFFFFHLKKFILTSYVGALN